MKKNLWLGVALAIMFSVSVGFSVFATDAQTNCIDDPTGMTNCGDATGGEEMIKTPIVVDQSALEFGRIMEAGRRYSKTLTIRNTTSEKMTIRLEAISYESNASNDSKVDAAEWVAFGGGKRKFDLKAGGNVQVSVRLMVPADVAGGTYYAKIKVSNGKEEEDQYVTVRADVALEGYQYGGKVVSRNVGFFSLNGKISASAKLKNEGTAGFTARYVVQYKNAFGLSEWKQLVEEEREVLPGAEELFEVKESEASIGYGIFTVEQKISYISSDNRQIEAVLSHAVVNLPWWSLMIVGGVILLAIVIAIAVKTSRKKTEKAEKAEKRIAKAKKKGITIEEDEAE